ncbi:MAG: helix-turn-helix transcriptional regulator [Candidatus Limnocylindrales bacterium]|nr:helix-turn-helix transcriptional regulator [Candidatus Limnocylindrales bacterium]
MRTVTTGAQATDAEPALSEHNAEGFHEWLQGQLKATKLSQRQLARKSGVDHSSISRLIRGDQVPSLDTAMRLARGIDPAEDNPGGFRPGAATGTNPAARVEYALRADDRLSEADVREIMLYYLATRRGRSSRPATATPAGHPDEPVPPAARATGARVPSEPSDRRRTPRE